MNVRLSFLICLLFLSCQEKRKEIVTTKEKKDIEEYVCNLEENIDIVGRVKDFSFYDDSSFFVLSDNNIIEYTTKGEQKNIFNKFGQGPGEYVSPTLINVYGESIYVWCAGTLKLIEYDKKGNYIRENSNYRKAIKNFKLLDKNLVCFYKSDGQKDGIIEIFSLNENKIIKSVGELTDEDLLLLSVESKPNMIIEGDNLYFTKPSELSLYQMHLKSFSLSEKMHFEDREFIVREGQDAHSMFNTDIQSAIKYMAENSIVDNLLKVGDNFYIKSEVGKYVIDFQNRKMDSKQRFDKYYLCDFRYPNIEDIQAIKGHNKKGGTHKYALFGNETYFLQEDDSSESEQGRIKVFKLKF